MPSLRNRILAVAIISVVSFLVVGSPTAAQQENKRDRLPIVIRGMDLPWANAGIPISEIYLYRYNGDSAANK